jgi:hypothetical protein
LPVGTEVIFVEADLSGIVSKQVLAQFDQALKARRDKRRKRARREDRDKRRAEQAERAKQPENEYVVHSALVGGGQLDPDQELAMALAQSRLDAGMPISAEVGAAFPLPSATGPTGTSPPTTLSRSPQATSGPGGSFAWAVHSRATSSLPARREHVEGVEEAWSTLSTIEYGETEADMAQGKKKKGGKKGQKLVLGGGGGGRRA